MMNAVRFHGREDLRFEQIPEPECGKGQIKIKPAWCGICGRVCILELETRGRMEREGGGGGRRKRERRTRRKRRCPKSTRSFMTTDEID